MPNSSDVISKESSEIVLIARLRMLLSIANPWAEEREPLRPNRIDFSLRSISSMSPFPDSERV
jgi:hypothetical protein